MEAMTSDTMTSTRDNPVSSLQVLSGAPFVRRWPAFFA
jgi:hypothetical protein